MMKSIVVVFKKFFEERKKMMKKLVFGNHLTVVVFCLTALLGVFAGSADAALVGGQNWADSVNTWSGSVQNYAGALMDIDTTWWLAGPSDSDVDNNGYAWDEDDNDYVAGWRSSGSATITMYFELALEDIVGDDVVIHIYGGSKASASVWASSDNVSYTNIGSIDGGTPGYFRDEAFDFGGAIDNIHYIRVDREAGGPETGMFFDSFASVPEPASVALLAFGGLGLLSRRNRRNR